MLAYSVKSVVKPANMLASSQRCFAKPAKAAGGGGGGGPPGEPTKIPEPRGKTMFERMIEDGEEFVLGPPAVPNKTWGAPR